MSRLRIGELAVQQGLLTREQLDECLRYLERMRKLPGQEDLRLGAVLVSKRLVTAAQLNALLAHQSRGAAAAAAAAFDRASAPRTAPVTDEQRESIRRSVEAASKDQAKKADAAIPPPPGLLDRIRRVHVATAAGLVVAVILVVVLWPAPAPKRVLRAYLESCDEARVAPDRSLALADLGLAIRECDDLTLLPAEHYDYAEEIAKFPSSEEDDWVTFLETVEMSDAKFNALAAMLGVLSEELTPRNSGGLRITVQPATCRLVCRQRGMGMYHEGLHRFTVMKATSPKWSSGWKVASCEPVGPLK